MPYGDAGMGDAAMNDTTRLIVGIILFLAGGAVLAFGDGSTGTTGIGTTAGVAGIGLAAWTWVSGRRSED